MITQSKNLKKLIISISIFITVSVAGFLFFSFDNTYDLKISKSLDIFFNVFREINLFYVDQIDPEKLVKEGIDGMLGSLDPYNEFIPESELSDFEFQTTGKYGGIGALIRKGGNYSVISELYEDFPAQKGGLKVGDTLISIGNQSIKNYEISSVSEMLRGTPGTELTILVRRLDRKDTLKFTLTRQLISIKNVPFYGILNNTTGYIKLSGFTRGAGEEVKNALNDLKKKYKISDLILDLRDNPGGLLDEAVNVVNVFVRKDQEVVSTKSKLKQWDNEYFTKNEPVDTIIPLIVLVNHGSASASEIVSGSLQDLDRALIVGQRTFGKGLVQTTRDISYNAKIKITTAKYYIPSGRCIQALDYSHRNEDGSVGYIPDSLISEFHTKHGRKVYDGGGITPDKTLPNKTYSNITVSLYIKNLISDYVTYFIKNSKAKPDPDNFNFTIDEYPDFKNYLKDKNFDYQTKSEASLKELIKDAKNEQYYNLALADFDDLESKLSHDKNKDLDLFKEEIIQFLNEEIISRYYYERGRFRFL